MMKNGTDLVAPQSVDDLKGIILAQFEALSPRLQQVARHVLDRPNEVAFETLATIAASCGTQPSTIVRFAQHFGFDGAAPMQKLLRDSLLRQSESMGYTERLRQFSNSLEDTPLTRPDQLLGEFVEGNIHALENLGHAADNEELNRAVTLIDDAESVFILGFRRAFPVATYLAYLLAQSGKRIVLVDGVAGFAALQLQGATARDLVIAISFHPYARETVDLVEALATREVPMMAISDSAISPIAKAARLVLGVLETEVRGFRSLAASMCLVQALAIFFGAFREKADEQAN